MRIGVTTIAAEGHLNAMTALADRFVPLSELTAPTLRALVDAVLSDPAYRQRAVQMQ